MTEKIYYMSFSDVGLVFPQEQDNDLFSPGIFTLLYTDKKQLLPTYTICAIHQYKCDQIKLNRIAQTNIFVAKINKIGVFYFRVEVLRYKYKGRVESLKNKKLRQLVSCDTTHLEEACLKHNFYFVGHCPTE